MSASLRLFDCCSKLRNSTLHSLDVAQVAEGHKRTAVGVEKLRLELNLGAQRITQYVYRTLLEVYVEHF